MGQEKNTPFSRSVPGGETSSSYVFHWGRPAGGVSVDGLEPAARLTCGAGGYAG